MVLKVIRDFLALESAGGLALMGAALIALLIDNSMYAATYESFFKMPFELNLGVWWVEEPLLFWVNEALMTLFFLLVGLTLKRELYSGVLSDRKHVMLPGVAALGGMIVPALIYVLLNYHDPIKLSGWATPVATDIAFALGVLSFFSRRIPISLKVFLMTLAIFDDLGSVLVIAFFYSHGLSWFFLGSAFVVIFLLSRLQKQNVLWLTPYVFLGALLWTCLYKGGVHPAIAGVFVGCFIPAAKGEYPISPLERLEDIIHPWVVFFVLPLFAFANAGISFKGMTADQWMSTVTLGIAAGLFFGKQIGVTLFSFIAIRLGFAKRIPHVSWSAMYGTIVLCGIGFTMSLFLGTLAFQGDDSLYLTEIRLGVLLGSLFSGLVGATVLILSGKSSRGLNR